MNSCFVANDERDCDGYPHWGHWKYRNIRDSQYEAHRHREGLLPRQFAYDFVAPYPMDSEGD